MAQGNKNILFIVFFSTTVLTGLNSNYQNHKCSIRFFFLKGSKCVSMWQPLFTAAHFVAAIVSVPLVHVSSVGFNVPRSIMFSGHPPLCHTHAPEFETLGMLWGIFFFFFLHLPKSLESTLNWLEDWCSEVPDLCNNVCLYFFLFLEVIWFMH